MNSDELKQKLTHYYNLRNQLRETNIEEKVNERLEEMRDEMTAKVKAEIDADINKCTYYIECLDELVKEQCDIEDKACEAMPENEESVEMPETEVAEPVEETEEVKEVETVEAEVVEPNVAVEAQSVPTSNEINII